MFMTIRGSQLERLSYAQQKQVYAEVYRELGLDKAVFYFNITPRYFPDTLHKVFPTEKKAVMKAWLKATQNREWVNQVFNKQEALVTQLEQLENTSEAPLYQKMATYLKTIHAKPDLPEATYIAKTLKDHVAKQSTSLLPKTQEQLNAYLDPFLNSPKKATSLTAFLPKFTWHGTNNQYHQWMVKTLRFDFGISMTDGQPAGKKIKDAFIWTFSYVLIAYLLSLFLSISLGLYTAYHQNKWQDRLISTGSFILYAVPLFWLGTMAIVFLTTDTYGGWLHIFPDIGVGSVYGTMSWLEKLIQGLPHLILPALLLSIHGTASAIRLVRNTAVVELKADYILTARSKGWARISSAWAP
jgi:peptide/nickel transport system permease protein